MPIRTVTTDAADATLGAYKIDPAVLDHLRQFTPVTLSDGAAPDGWLRRQAGFYHGADPTTPSPGDLRASFNVVAPGTVSVLAGQQGERLTGFASAKGQTIAVAVPGTVDARTMFGDERSGAKGVAWLLRAIGFAFVLIGLVLLMRPLAVLVSVLPFLETVVDVSAFIVMFGVAALITLVTIAIAHIVLQPLLALGLIVAGIAVAVLCTWLRGPRAATPAPPGSAMRPAG
jgi:hypothetical protein